MLPCSWDPGQEQKLHLDSSSPWGGGCFVPTPLLCTQTLRGVCITLKIPPQVSHHLIKGLFLHSPHRRDDCICLLITVMLFQHDWAELYASQSILMNVLVFNCKQTFTHCKLNVLFQLAEQYLNLCAFFFILNCNLCKIAMIP